MASLLDTNLRKKIEKRRHEERDARIWRRLSAILWLALISTPILDLTIVP